MSTGLDNGSDGDDPGWPAGEPAVELVTEHLAFAVISFARRKSLDQIHVED
ncbi:hypothetical protein PP577_18500 [Mycobacteroides abscessus]|nr:hypothetical protein [Mycobacteroides abscessus]MDM2431792.1 hypothetical protein [Mycobacteroides abscessus]MDM2436596.1 hypothetical protein [Mycobacteroides abscessus]MDM2438895.1 hypothetical protein [Mycobacteroides abscessus]